MTRDDMHDLQRLHNKVLQVSGSREREAKHHTAVALSLLGLGAGLLLRLLGIL